MITFKCKVFRESGGELVLFYYDGEPVFFSASEGHSTGCLEYIQELEEITGHEAERFVEIVQKHYDDYGDEAVKLEL